MYMYSFTSQLLTNKTQKAVTSILSKEWMPLANDKQEIIFWVALNKDNKETKCDPNSLQGLFS